MGATATTVEGFVRDGFVLVEGAFPRDVAAACQEEVWKQAGLDRGDAGDRAVVRVTPRGEVFRLAANTSVLLEWYDALLGSGTWWPRPDVGQVVIRCPALEEPDDIGWHVEGSFLLGDDLHRNIFSRDRGLLLLMLISDVGSDDAPTRIRVGSHFDAARALVAAGADGRGSDFYREADEVSAHRPETVATGRAGDVYLCHPFIVHTAQVHRGQRPRLVAQPPIALREPFALDRQQTTHCPVERSILLALNGDT